MAQSGSQDVYGGQIGSGLAQVLHYDPAKYIAAATKPLMEAAKAKADKNKANAQRFQTLMGHGAPKTQLTSAMQNVISPKYNEWMEKAHQNLKENNGSYSDEFILESQFFLDDLKAWGNTYDGIQKQITKMDKDLSLGENDKYEEVNATNIENRNKIANPFLYDAKRLKEEYGGDVNAYWADSANYKDMIVVRNPLDVEKSVQGDIKNMFLKEEELVLKDPERRGSHYDKLVYEQNFDESGAKDWLKYYYKLHKDEYAKGMGTTLGKKMGEDEFVKYGLGLAPKDITKRKIVTDYHPPKGEGETITTQIDGDEDYRLTSVTKGGTKVTYTDKKSGEINTPKGRVVSQSVDSRYISVPGQRGGDTKLTGNIPVLITDKTPIVNKKFNDTGKDQTVRYVDEKGKPVDLFIGKNQTIPDQAMTEWENKGLSYSHIRKMPATAVVNGKKVPVEIDYNKTVSEKFDTQYLPDVSEGTEKKYTTSGGKGKGQGKQLYSKGNKLWKVTKN